MATWAEKDSSSNIVFWKCNRCSCVRSMLCLELDRNNYIIWRPQMENVILANGFEEHIKGMNVYPYKNNKN